jgi:hypothetical protein
VGWLASRIGQGKIWLLAQREPITWSALRARLTAMKLLPRTYAGRFAVLGGIVLFLLLVLPWYAKSHKDEKGVVTYPNAALITICFGIIAGRRSCNMSCQPPSTGSLNFRCRNSKSRMDYSDLSA